ncbi:hypothetical protein DQ04_02711070, partial [Trypanosoma grayi]|uniref:hypothetical protein n=1 Tax=Trypanosoma grayi TaxID=71804 RepID=UPI0004F4B817
TVGGETQPHDAGTPQPEVVAPLLSTASCDGASTAVSVPLVWALRANWGRCDPPRRRDWRMHGSGAHTAALARATTVRPASAAAASGAGGGMIKQQEPLWERPASALLTSGMSRARPHYASSCSSSTVTHKMTTAAPTTTTPTTAA